MQCDANVAIAIVWELCHRNALAARGINPVLTKQVYLALGSNLGNREKHLSDAIAAIGSNNAITVITQSSVLETAPVGEVQQGYFLNAVVEIETVLSPQDLMRVCLEIEVQQGRTRSEKWGPRTIDIDLLFFSDRLLDEEGLRVPHPELQNRSFVLIPLVEIAPMIVHPSLGLTAEAMLRAL